MTLGRGLLVIVSGPSGVGKGTIHARVRDELDDVVLSVSLTTRDPRPGERDGVDYRFVDRPTFERAIEDAELLEWAEYAGHLYGTPAGAVDEAIARGEVVILDVELEGACNLKQTRPDDTLTIALVPPSMAELERRLRTRGTEDEATIERRLEVVRSQTDAWDRFDVVIVNDDVDRCVAETIAAIERARRS